MRSRPPRGYGERTSYNRSRRHRRRSTSTSADQRRAQPRAFCPPSAPARLDHAHAPRRNPGCRGAQGRRRTDRRRRAMMVRDTTGIEPDFTLVKFKKLAAAATSRSSTAPPENLSAYRYTKNESPRSVAYAVGHGRLTRRRQHHASLNAKGLTPERSEDGKALPTAFDIKFAFNEWTLGAEFLRTTSASTPKPAPPRASTCSRTLGLHHPRNRCRQRPCLRRHDHRRRPALEARALCRVQCADPCAHRQALSVRRTHVRMLTTARPSVSAPSKTINVPNKATVKDSKEAYKFFLAARLKANALYATARNFATAAKPLIADEEDNDDMIGAFLDKPPPHGLPALAEKDRRESRRAHFRDARARRMPDQEGLYPRRPSSTT